MSDLIKMFDKEENPRHTRPEGKSKTWLADVEVHFTVSDKWGSDIEHWDSELVCTDSYLNQMGDDLECLDWEELIENPDPNTVYVVRGGVSRELVSDRWLLRSR